MKISIKEESYISELGKRTNNEDNCGYISGLAYIVCDGVGGSEKGEIASDITVKSFLEQLKLKPETHINQILRMTEGSFSNYLNNHPDATGMATTLTLTTISAKGIVAAWIGDSRIYQFRNGEITFKSIDHSWVNEALKSGIISAEDAINHPKSNVITRAIQGNHRPVELEEIVITDIKDGDIFLQCSDGVLESWNDGELKELFLTNSDVAEITKELALKCSVQSKDNYTAIVYKIEKVEDIEIDRPILNDFDNRSETKEDWVEAVPLSIEEQKQIEGLVQKGKTKKNNKMIYVVLLLILILLSVGISIKYIIPNKQKTEQKEDRNGKNSVLEQKEEVGNQNQIKNEQIDNKTDIKKDTANNKEV